MKKVTLALGGGGSKGYAHLGVLRVLEREGYQVCALAGTSAGGLIGSLYAYGYNPDEIQELVSRSLPKIQYRRGSQDGPSWLGLAEIRQFLEDTLGDCAFEDLRIPFAVTAVDLETAEHLILHSGRVVDALLATIAVPGVFPPANYQGRMLVDGGVMDPVPVGEARELYPELPVVAVVLSPLANEWEEVTQPRLLSSLPQLSSYLGRFRTVQALNIFLRAVDIGGVVMTELLLKLDAPDVIVRPDLHGIGLLDSVDMAEVALLGEQAMQKALPELKRTSTFTGYLRRRLRRRLAPRPVHPLRFPAAGDMGGGERV